MNAQPTQIVLIEDSPADAELTVRALKKHRVANEILLLKDGEEALEYFFATGSYAGRPPLPLPKLVLLDLKLPKVDGLEVLRRLKTDPGTRRIPVVILTASREERDLAESYELGVNSYLVKPVNSGQFAETARTLGLYWLLLNQIADKEV
ncbi:MAG: response regulator [Kiritimatiellaeota bacterium]|nr:response regulator [Kiritimatiellota bacterium]